MASLIASRSPWNLTRYVGPEMGSQSRERYQLTYRRPDRDAYIDNITLSDLTALMAMLADLGERMHGTDA